MINLNEIAFIDEDGFDFNTGESLIRFDVVAYCPDTKQITFAIIGKPKAAAFLRDMTEKSRKQDMSSFVISSQCNNCMAYQAKYKRKTATAK